MYMIYASNAPGVPEDQIKNLEAVAQATVYALYDLCNSIHSNLPSAGFHSFGDYDYTITGCPNGCLLVEDHSAGWWSVLQASTDRYGLTVFRVFAKQKKVPLRLQKQSAKGNLSWDFLEQEFLYGRADIYIHATRSQEDSWYGPLHKLDFQHPLLKNLKFAMEDLSNLK
jgi:hypothetical protein